MRTSKFVNCADIFADAILDLEVDIVNTYFSKLHHIDAHIIIVAYTDKKIAEESISWQICT